MSRKWYRLDNASKLFTAVSTDSNKAVFRVSATIEKHVDPIVLQKTTDKTLKRFPGFSNRVKRGFFWNYLEENPERLVIEKETTNICESFDVMGYHKHLIRVLYYHDKISLEVSHIISDGAGALEFFKVLLFYYLSEIGYKLDEDQLLFKLTDEPTIEEWTDSFKKYASLEQLTENSQTALKLKGTHINEMKVIHGSVDLTDIKKCAATYQASLTEFIMALIIFSIYQSKPTCDEKHPITVSLPVNLRGMFPSVTLTNFFGVANISVLGNRSLTLSQIVELVQKDYKEKNTKEKLQFKINENVALEEKYYAKIIPYVIKEKAMRFGFSKNGESQKTTTLSNLGSFKIPDELKGSVKAINVVSYPTKNVPINCSMISFEDRLNITFVRNIEEVDFISNFFRILTLEKGVNVEITSV